MASFSKFRRYITERALLGTDQLWLTLDEETLTIVEPVRDFALHLHATGSSRNTLRSYVPRVTEFLNWCHDNHIDWRVITLRQMARYKRFLAEGITTRRKTRKPETVAAHLTAVLEFFRNAVRERDMSPEVVNRLTVDRFLTHLPRQFDPGESGQNRRVRSHVLRTPIIERVPRALSPEEWDAVLACCSSSREILLFRLLHDSGLRIGEALGMRRSDVHFLADSRSLNCRFGGPHVHVTRRLDNDNGALAKSGRSRPVPASRDVVKAYFAYMRERDSYPAAIRSDYLLVSLDPRFEGRPLSYSAVKKTFDRVRRATGISDFTPHILRHTAATNWLHVGGAEIDTVRDLLGHASLASTNVYVHPSDEGKRRAIDDVEDFFGESDEEGGQR